MQKYPLIFSSEWKYRLLRHVLFWLSWWLFNAIIYTSSPAYDNDSSYFLRFFHSSINAFFYLFQHIFFAYLLMYYVLPKFVFKNKYFQASIITLFLIFIIAAISPVIGKYVLDPFWNSILPSNRTISKSYNQGSFFRDWLGGLRGSITIGGFAAAIKLMKYHFDKEQRNLELQKQNISSQHQLLKAQVHPHFLFNTLNNIYSHTQVASPESPKLVAGLSDLLRYILYECNQPFVPLYKELKMLQDYISLEQIRYNNQLDLSIDIPKKDEDLVIAPLLLLPLIENSFKHGVSQMLEQPWIGLTILITDKQLKLKLVNGKGKQLEKKSRGIGLNNVQKRLELLYPKRHHFHISETEDAFIVSMNIELEKAQYESIAENPLAAYA
jgi:sensor histidine kinase YesM